VHPRHGKPGDDVIVTYGVVLKDERSRPTCSPCTGFAADFLVPPQRQRFVALAVAVAEVICGRAHEARASFGRGTGNSNQLRTSARRPRRA